MKPCGCNSDALGLTDHLSHVRSFEKLTGNVKRGDSEPNRAAKVIPFQVAVMASA